MVVALEVGVVVVVALDVGVVDVDSGVVEVTEVGVVDVGSGSVVEVVVVAPEIIVPVVVMTFGLFSRQNPS